MREECQLQREDKLELVVEHGLSHVKMNLIISIGNWGSIETLLNFIEVDSIPNSGMETYKLAVGALETNSCFFDGSVIDMDIIKL